MPKDVTNKKKEVILKPIIVDFADVDQQKNVKVQDVVVTAVNNDIVDFGDVLPQVEKIEINPVVTINCADCCTFQNSNCIIL